MKPEIMLLFAFFSLGGFFKPVFSQDLHEGNLFELTAADHLLIQEELSDSSYQVFHFPYSGLNYSLKEAGADSAMTIQFKIDSLYDWQMTLEENEIRSGNYLLAATADTTGVSTVWQKSSKVNTYKGLINGDTSQWVAMYVSESRMGGLLNIDGDLLYLKPLMDFIPDSTYSHSFILYKAGSEKELGGFVCLTNDTIVDAGDTLLSPRSETERYLEYAVDVDKEFFDRYKGAGQEEQQIYNVENVILGYINDVHVLYHHAVNLNIQLVYLHIWTAEDDPYSGNIQAHWNQLRSQWNGPKGCVNKDACVLLTGKPGALGADGYVNYWGENSICGIENPSYCPTPLNAYAVVKDNNDYCSAFIAHELGHNFGLQHDCTVYANYPKQGQTTCNVMWTGSPQEDCPDCPNGPVLRFTDDDPYGSKPTLNSHLEAGKKYTCFFNEENDEWEFKLIDYDICLRTPAPMDYEFKILLEPEKTILGDFPVCDDEFTLTFSDAFSQEDIEWGLGPNLVLESGTLNDLSLNLKSTGSGPTYVTVTFEYNCEEIIFKREFNVGKPVEPGLPFFTHLPLQADITMLGFRKSLEQPIIKFHGKMGIRAVVTEFPGIPF